jgi:trehalose 6-phosphate phosphatase
MKYLFSMGGLKLLESLSFARTLYAFDFDGTLSKIVLTPEEASINRTSCELLKALRKYAPVAIISGRSIRDLRSRLPFKPTYLIGNHGLEGLSKNRSTTLLAEGTCGSWKKQLQKSLGSHLKNGISLEDKVYSLALHYRKSHQKRKIKLFLLDVASRIQPSPRMILGKCVINLVPVGGPHKGVALADLMLEADVKSAFYIGDDDTDEDVFALSNMRILGVRVGRKRLSQAKFYIERQSEINRLLRRLISFYEESNSSPTLF